MLTRPRHQWQTTIDPWAPNPRQSTPSYGFRAARQRCVKCGLTHPYPVIQWNDLDTDGREHTGSDETLLIALEAHTAELQRIGCFVPDWLYALTRPLRKGTDRSAT